MSKSSGHVLWIAIVVLACGIRVHNAFQYPLMGYDALYNWQYVESLTESWELPDPEAGWSTSHPPLFYYVSAALVRALPEFADRQPRLEVVGVRLIGSLAGLLMAWLAAACVRSVAPGDVLRARLAAALVLFTPAHIYLSGMFHEEIWVATFSSLAVYASFRGTRARSDKGSRFVAMGLAGGLAWLTKLTGALTLAAVALAELVEGLRARRTAGTFKNVAVLCVVALAVGGWYYARNWFNFGYLYPQSLPVHEVMFTMPPGVRMAADYFRLPLATFTDPQLLAPDLLRSIWGSTYATLWFDGHRMFLPARDPAVSLLGGALLFLALIPSLAFALGIFRGMLRALRAPGSGDLPLLFLIAITLAGYVLFTWQNPTFAVLKGTYLLGLSIPFAFYASEVLSGGLRKAGPSRTGLAVALALLLALVVAACSFGVFFDKLELAGLHWQPEALP